MSGLNSSKGERLFEALLLLCALISILGIVFIAFFVFTEGSPLILEKGADHFLLGMEWKPLEGIYGLAPMILGSIAVTILALIIGVPLGLSAAIFLAEMAPVWAEKILRPAVELLAGIPSVIYGLFGMTMLVPWVRKLALITGIAKAGAEVRSGYSLLTAAIILAVMILPTIISVSEDALRAVPQTYKEGSLALGATHWQTIARVIVPTASSGLFAAVILGVGRAIGETMAVIMVAGNAPIIPKSVFSSFRTLTGNIALEYGYAGPEHMQALFVTGIVLFIFIMLINIVARRMNRGEGK